VNGGEGHWSSFRVGGPSRLRGTGRRWGGRVWRGLVYRKTGQKPADKAAQATSG
jgi:hypothetical protein